VLVLDLLIALLTFKDYGLGWDDYTHAQYGELLLTLYRSGFTNDRVFSFVNLYFYGGGLDMAAGLLAKFTALELFEARRLTGALVGIVGLIATWRLGRRLGGPFAGLIALILLATCPIYDGHMYINAKDTPFATAMIVLVYSIVRVIDEYPRPSHLSVAVFGIGLGLAFGCRILAAVLAPCAVVALMMIVFEESRIQNFRSAGRRALQFIGHLLPSLLIGYLIMGLLWPWSILDPLNPILASEYFSNFFEKPWRELFQGRLISVPDMPASYLPQLFAIKLPEIMLTLGFAGVAGALVAFYRRDVPLVRGAALFFVILAALFPVGVAVVARPALYNGLRHFIFVIPPFAVLGGLAATAFAEALRRYRRPVLTGAFVAVFLTGIILPVTDIVRLHPFQYTFFNWASGGVAMAHERYMVDYWGLAFKQAGNALRDTLRAAGQKPPRDRHWIVEICGAKPAAEIALGPDFEITYERRRADFSMMLGNYYCDELRAPTIVKVTREGVNYARVYDLRGGMRGATRIAPTSQGTQ
jgi:Dolichyl-phosphate-mannose-protein mannosyltransferase